jgi:hypothetical protein
MSTVAVAHWTAPPLFHIPFVELVLSALKMLLSLIYYSQRLLVCMAEIACAVYPVHLRIHFSFLHTSRVSESLPPVSCARWNSLQSRLLRSVVQLGALRSVRLVSAWTVQTIICWLCRGVISSSDIDREAVNRSVIPIWGYGKSQTFGCPGDLTSGVSSATWGVILHPPPFVNSFPIHPDLG